MAGETHHVPTRRQPNAVEIIGLVPFGLGVFSIPFVLFRAGAHAGWGDVLSGAAALGALLVLGLAMRFAPVFWAFVTLVALYYAALAGVMLSGHAVSPAQSWLADPVGWFDGTKPLAEASPALIADLTTWRGGAVALATFAFLMWCARRWRQAAMI
jgi:hypothetical protein